MFDVLPGGEGLELVELLEDEVSAPLVSLVSLSPLIVSSSVLLSTIYYVPSTIYRLPGFSRRRQGQDGVRLQSV